MKSFNIEEYLKNPSRKVVTRDGRKVKRILCTDARGKYPIVALVESYDGTADNSLQYTKDGRYIVDCPSSMSDLFFAPEKHEGWMNLYKKNFGLVIGDLVHNSEEAAKKIAAGDEDYITTIKVEWEE